MASLKTRPAHALLFSIGVGALTFSGAAHAATEGVDSGADTTDSRSLGNHQRHLRFDLGARTQFIKGAGFDPFSEKDVLPQLSAQASWAFWARDALSLAGVVAFDYGDTSARAQ